MLEFRQAKESDIPFLLALREETMAQHLMNSGVNLDADAQMARVMYRFDCAKVVVLGGVDVGLLKVSRDVSPWELIQIQVSPTLQGRGLGGRLVQQIISDAQEDGADVELSVLKANPARALYERLGFRVFSENDSEYLLRRVI